MTLPAAFLVVGLLLERQAQAQFVTPSTDATTDESTTASENNTKPSTELDLRLTVSSFAYAESGDDADPLIDGGLGPQTASPHKRLFGDLRLEVGAKNISGAPLEARFDGRFRETNRADVQSGFRGGQEINLRDAYVRYGGEKRNLTIGRHWISAADSNKVDGISFEKQARGPWSLVLFGGLFPTRGSRSIDQDYPRGEIRYAEDGTMTEVGRRIVPAIAGAGANYAKPKVHGDVGAGAIVPFRQDGAEPSRIGPQFFVHSKGYWLTSDRTTVYHYATADLASPQGSAVRNLNASIRTQATSQVVLRASANHQSTDLLRQSVINQLEDPDTSSMGLVQNALALSRVSSQSVRAAASIDAGKRRFQFTLGGSVRQRPEVEFVLADASRFAIPTSRRAEVTVQALDRRSVFGLRVGGQASLIQGIGRRDLATSKGGVGSLEVSKEFFQGRTLLTMDGAVQSLEDADRLRSCDPADPNTCYGQSKVQAVQAGLQLTVQTAKHWLFLVDGHWGIERVETFDANRQPLALPTVQSLTAFARLQYRYR